MAHTAKPGTEAPSHPQGKSNSSGHMPPTTLHFRILHSSSETTLQWMERMQATWSFPCTHSPHSLPQATSSQVPGKAPPQCGFTLGQIWQVLRNVRTVRQGSSLPTTASLLPSTPCSRAVLLAQTHPGKRGPHMGAGSPHPTFSTLKHMVGARSALRGLKGHQGSFPPMP